MFDHAENTSSVGKTSRTMYGIGSSSNGNVAVTLVGPGGSFNLRLGPNVPPTLVTFYEITSINGEVVMFSKPVSSLF